MIDPARKIALLTELEKRAAPGDSWDNIKSSIRGGVDRMKNAPVMGGPSLNKMMSRAHGAAWAGPSKVVAAPIKSGTERAKELLLGEKATHGPHKGSRLHPVKGGPGGYHGGLKVIEKAEYDAIKAGSKKGQVSASKIGGKTFYFKRKFRPGGLAGVMMRHPGKSALGALALYWLAKKENRQAAGQAVGGMLPGMPKGPTEDVQKEWSQQLSYKNPLSEQAWG
jgi:hypothetical protein